MKIIVSYSGGKDSQASLIWSVKKYGSNNVEAVFCDTGWEHPITYQHIKNTTNQLNVKLVTVKSKKYNGLIDLAKKKKRFPSAKARFCTSELKTIPFIDYILEQKEHLLIIQGIRSQESYIRSQMQAQCRFFKYYFYPINDNGKMHSYRKQEVISFCEKFSDDILRPVFFWSGQQVIDYIKKNEQEPNELYKQGFKRVGCFPCVLSSQREVYSLLKRYPERFEEIIQHEQNIRSSFFKIYFAPLYERTGICHRTGIKFSTALDVRRYLESKNNTIDLFKNDNDISCSSYYHLCE